MAKKSAKSKGFRRQSVKKPYLSKRDIVLLCVLVAAVAVGAFFLFRYDDGALKVQDGAVVADGDNWLIVNGSGSRGGARYFKLGEIGEIDGYAREKEGLSTDGNIPEYMFTPEADSAVESVSVTTSHNGAEALANYAATRIVELVGNEAGEVQSVDLGGQAVKYFVYTSAPAEGEEAAEEASETEEEASEEAAEEATEGASETAEAAAEEAAEPAGEGAEEAPEEAAEADGEAAEEAAEPASKPYHKSLSAYFDASHNSCIVVHVVSGADTAEDCPADEDLLAELEKAVSTVTLEAAK